MREASRGQPSTRSKARAGQKEGTEASLKQLRGDDRARNRKKASGWRSIFGRSNLHRRVSFKHPPLQTAHVHTSRQRESADIDRNSAFANDARSSVPENVAQNRGRIQSRQKPRLHPGMDRAFSPKMTPAIPSADQGDRRSSSESSGNVHRIGKPGEGSTVRKMDIPDRRVSFSDQSM